VLPSEPASAGSAASESTASGTVDAGASLVSLHAEQTASTGRKPAVRVETPNATRDRWRRFTHEVTATDAPRARAPPSLRREHAITTAP
jgi:hypothetical protein